MKDLIFLIKTSFSHYYAVSEVKSLLYSKKVTYNPAALTLQSEQSFFLGVTQDSLPNIVNYITGTPILSKQILSVAPGGAIHYDVNFTSGSSYNL